MSVGVSQSKLHQLRAMISLAYVDGVFAPEEREMIEGLMAKESLSQEQIDILHADMETPPELMEMYLHIDDEQDRDTLLPMAYDLFWSDGDYNPEEKDAFELLKSRLKDQLDKGGL